MKLLLVVLAILGAVYADTSKWLEFRVKFAVSPIGAGETSFWKIPHTFRDALNEGYRPVTTENTLGATTLCYKTERRVCPLYDGQGTIAGMLLAIPPSNVEGQGIPYDMNRFPVYEKKAVGDKVFWTSTYYLVDPNVITSGGRPNDVPLIGEGLWLKSGKEFVQVPTDLVSLQSSKKYTWQNCLPSMGIHYYYNMTRETICEDVQPYFLLYKDGNMVGLGWQFFGRTTPEIRDYYDFIDSLGVKMAVPVSPPCLAANADLYGVISIHMYFVKDPWTIECKQSIESVEPIPGLP